MDGIYHIGAVLPAEVTSVCVKLVSPTKWQNENKGANIEVEKQVRSLYFFLDQKQKHN